MANCIMPELQRQPGTIEQHKKGVNDYVHHYDRSIMEWIRQCRYGITVLLSGGARPICQPISELNRRNIMAIFLFIITESYFFGE